MTITKQLSNLLLAAVVGSAGSAVFAGNDSSAQAAISPAPVLPTIVDRSAPVCETSARGAFKTCAQTTVLQVEGQGVFIQRTKCTENTSKGSGICDAQVTKFGAVSHRAPE